MNPAEPAVQRRNLESAVSNSLYLRGLGLVPGGLIFVLGALAMWEVGPLRHLWVAYAAMGALIPLGVWINRYYDEHYGHVTPSTTHWVQAAVHGGVLAVLAIAVWLLLRSADLALNALALVWGMGMLAVSASTVGLRRHRVIIWGTLVLAGLLPIWNEADANAAAWLLGGLALIASGIFDHRLLARTSEQRAGLETRDAGA